ncbi:procathepsin L-like [Saccostrea echinata]|uniref:procathepsin L-like n=1 Tax=Saccostrea echinata TaxID=191078 RepID=UPI002A80D66C|nr:procathepsin L-like [Saccostrea echinata]
MLSLVLLAVVTVHALAAQFDVTLDSEWEMYQVTYRKSYGVTETARRQIWEDNVRLIEKHNLEADRGVHTYWLGMNEYGDMTNEEFTRVMNGLIMPNKTEYNLFKPTLDEKDLPDTVDWREKGYVTEVKNQGQCGSCWAFSTTGSLEGQHFKSTNKLVSLSEQNLVDCSKPEGNKGCQGGLMDKAFNYIEKNKGIDTEQSYPYHAKNGKCHFDASNVGATEKSHKDIKKGSEDDLQQAVATIGPISVGIDASHGSFQLYSRGVYNEPRCSSKKLDHGVLVVGYGTEGKKDYWLVKNSWGKSWGMKGYIMMSRNKKNQCGIATGACYPVV